ncbi:DNA-binding IscR family transcriptional regulator [Alkalibacillus flavidus]|uniref:DNA-binding IscR family transcriptional regulator n=1 Tax=Alkalibacillus flavidus TaxID=546021 RepID=A0ABV2KY04_9BACI
MSEEKAYWTHEIASILNVSDSTLRKWCMALEKEGYVFTKGENNSRAFLVRDKQALLYFKQLVKVEGRTIKMASVQVFNEFLSNERTTPVRTEYEGVRGAFDSELKKLNDRMDKQEEFNQKLLDRIDQRDSNLMAVLREVQEHKKELAMTKKKKWWQFWK